MDSYNAKIFKNSDSESSDIENMISRPLSFSYCDDFFTEGTPNTQYNPQDCEILVNPKTDNTQQKQTGTSCAKYTAATEDTSSSMKYEPAPEEKREAPHKKEFTASVNIFGEERNDEDFLLNYDINRLFDIQKEISILANTLQRYQANQTKIVREKNILRSRQEEELIKKKRIIDDLVNDISGLYENLKVRESIIAEKEKLILESGEQKVQKTAEKTTAQNVQEQKNKTTAAQPLPKSNFTFAAADDFGLNNISIGAINDAISSLK